MLPFKKDEKSKFSKILRFNVDSLNINSSRQQKICFDI